MLHTRSRGGEIEESKSYTQRIGGAANANSAHFATLSKTMRTYGGDVAVDRQTIDKSNGIA